MDLEIIQRFWSKVDKSSDCWMWTGAKSDFGHGRFVVRKGDEERAHRFSWIITYGEIPDGLIVCHKCDNSSCVRPEHLFLGTKYDNTQDMLKKRRNIRGSLASWSKLTKEDVENILKDSRPQKEIAKQYNTTQQNISAIKRRENWKDIV